MSRLKKIRLSRNIKQAELARLLKVTRAAVCFLEKNGIRNAAAAARYAEALNCNPADLIDFEHPAHAGEQ